MKRKDVLYSGHTAPGHWKDIDEFFRFAKLSGYRFFAWNDRIYFTTAGTYMDTGLKVDSLNYREKENEMSNLIITLNLLKLLERETTNFILAAIPHMLQLPTDEFEQLLPILTAAREHLREEYAELPMQGIEEEV